MKNLFKTTLFAVLLLVGVNAMAQDLPFTLGVKAGMSLSNFGGDLKDTDAKIGFNIGATLDYAFTEQIYLLTGLEFITKGCKIKEGDYKETYNPMYLQLPIRAGYKLDLGNNMKVVFSAGPYLAYGIGGKMKYEEDDESEKFDFFGDKRCKRFDFGLGLGVGLEFGKFNVGLGYDFGLIDISDNNTKIKNQNGYLAIGYKF